MSEESRSASVSARVVFVQMDNSRSIAPDAVFVMKQAFWLMLVLSIVACGRSERMDALYAQRCLGCHGQAGNGDGPLAQSLPVPPPDFRDTVERKTNSQIRRAIAEGQGTMPAFSPALLQSEISDMLQMVRFLSREGRETRWWEKFDTLVVAHCSLPWETILGYDEPAEQPKP
jgi:hypothetical protein